MATTLGVIIGNRTFFPDALARDGREEVLGILKQHGYNTVCLSPQETKHGSVVSLQDAHRCADLFKQHRDEIDGILVSLPNFGEERGVADALRLTGLDVPILIQAYPDDPNKMMVSSRGDSFCGKMSLCNNLWQYGIRYSLTTLHTEAPSSPVFTEDIKAFAATCRIIKGLKHIRVGMLGARPAAFNTVRFSERLLENQKISVETLDLYEAFGRVDRLKNDDASVKAKITALQNYISTESVPAASLLKMAKFAVVIDEWMKANELAGTAIQCWTAIEELFGIVPCAVMSLLSNNLMPSACETDVTGLIGMYILQLASGEPSAIVDWNNNFGDDPDKAVIFHCSNLPKHFFENPKMDFQEIISGSVGKENAFGTVSGTLKSGPLTYCRISTDDLNGKMRAYSGEGEITNDRLRSFGGYGVVKIPRMQKLLKFICKNGFEHHVAISRSNFGRAVAEALTNYKGWDTYNHDAEE